MALTGVLGTVDSNLGNVELAPGAQAGPSTTKARVSQISAEAITAASPLTARVSQVSAEIIAAASPLNARVSQISAEVIAVNQPITFQGTIGMIIT